MTNDDLCAQFPLYLMGEMTDAELAAFREHVLTCSQCGDDERDVWPIHERLLTGDGADLIPDDIAANIRTNILSAVTTSHLGVERARISQPERLTKTNRFRRRQIRRPLGAALASLLFGVVIGIAGAHYGWLPGVITPNVNMQTIALASTVLNRKATATVMLVNDGHTQHLMVNTAHLAQAGQWGCYDVWLLQKNHHYRSIGEFVVDAAGNGSIAGHVPIGVPYTSIEITLEPSWGNTRPHGRVVLQGKVAHHG